MQEKLKELYKSGYTKDINGNIKKLTGEISVNEAKLLTYIIKSFDVKKAIETGVANGVSSVANCDGFKNKGCILYGVDPCQLTEHNSSADPSKIPVYFHQFLGKTNLQIFVKLDNLEPTFNFYKRF